MKKVIFTSFMFLLLSGVAMSAGLQGKVVSVIDGNTLKVAGTDGQTYHLLLAGIDCPELKQSFGQEAKKCLEKLTLGKKVDFEVTGKDRMGNMTAIILVNGKSDPRIQLLKEGLAWTDESRPEADLELHRTSSQLKKKGLWKDGNPTPPWIFRREQSMSEAKSS